MTGDTATVHVDATALSKLRSAVVEKHGHLRGELGKEATRAIREHTRRLQEDVCDG